MTTRPATFSPTSPRVLDGGLSTYLECDGHVLEGELWSAALLLDAPDAVRGAHRVFLEAGATCLTTATYQASFDALARRGLSRAESLAAFELGVRLASEARGERRDVLVAASLGSYGACRADGSEFRGGFGLSVDELAGFHRPRLAAVARGADVVAFETVPELAEVEAVARLADQHELPAWISVTVRDGATLRSGEPLAAAFDIVAASRAAAFAINCSAPAHVTAALERLPRGEVPVLAYANSGETWADGRWSGERPARPFVEYARDWLDRGAAGVGGCCRVTVEDIRAVAAMVRARGGRSAD